MMRLLPEEKSKRPKMPFPPSATAGRVVTHQLGRGHPILLDVSLQMSRQLQGQRTYFFPVGGFLMGWETERSSSSSQTEPPAARTLAGANRPHRGLVADRTLDHVLVQLPVQVDQGLTHPAVDDRHPASVRAGDGCVGRR